MPHVTFVTLLSRNIPETCEYLLCQRWGPQWVGRLSSGGRKEQEGILDRLRLNWEKSNLRENTYCLASPPWSTQVKCNRTWKILVIMFQTSNNSYVQIWTKLVLPSRVTKQPSKRPMMLQITSSVWVKRELRCKIRQTSGMTKGNRLESWNVQNHKKEVRTRWQYRKQYKTMGRTWYWKPTTSGATVISIVQTPIEKKATWSNYPFIQL